MSPNNVNTVYGLVTLCLAWFEVEVQSMVLDLVGYRLPNERYHDYLLRNSVTLNKAYCSGLPQPGVETPGKGVNCIIQPTSKLDFVYLNGSSVR